MEAELRSGRSSFSGLSQLGCAHLDGLAEQWKRSKLPANGLSLLARSCHLRNVRKASYAPFASVYGVLHQEIATVVEAALVARCACREAEL